MIVRWHRPTAREVDHELLWGWVLLASAGGALLALASGSLPEVLTVCPLKLSTGVPCPTCGATRAVLSLLRGELGLAFRLHPLIPLVVTALGLYVPYALVVSMGKLPRLRVTPSPQEALAIRGAIGVVLAATWVFLFVDGR